LQPKYVKNSHKQYVNANNTLEKAIKTFHKEK
jgi:hypothetical protein